MIDTHCHLNFKAFNKDVDNVISRFNQKGGEALIVVGAKIDSSMKAIEIAKKHPTCFASIGYHPHHIDKINNLEEVQEQLEELVNKDKVIAVGETGIDYYQYKNSPPITLEDKNLQKELFLLHLNLANRNKLPIIIHCRETQDDIFSYISDYMKEQCVTGVFHCFDGSNDYLESVLSLGFYIGFDGNITYKENEHLRLLVKNTPLERLLIETDSPYLTPVPFRGKRNEPAYISYTIKTISQIKGMDPEEIAQITSKNARELFNISLS